MLLRFVLLFATFFLAFWVYRFVLRCGFSQRIAWLCAIGVIIFPPIFIPMYFLIFILGGRQGSQTRYPSRQPVKLCPKCGHENMLAEQVCSVCKNNLVI
jgi:hypothetical protein